MKTVLFLLAFAIAVGLYASEALACGVCGPADINQDCTTGDCAGQTIKVGAECMQACCYGAGNRTCGAMEIMAPSP